MADNNGGGGMPVIAFALGGMLVLLALIFAFGGFPGMRSGPDGPNITDETPAPKVTANVTIFERDRDPDTNVTIFERNRAPEKK
jgi:hypothetical protein